ncbi:MAG: DUF6249 domain-containing protein [Caulobacterales bacterium]
MIPIFGIFMIIAVVVGPIWIRSYYAARDRAQIHETLRTAYEKGQPVPPELIERLQGSVETRPYSTSEEADLRRGVVLVCVGLGMLGLGVGAWYAFMSVSDIAAWIVGGMIAGSGAIPGFIGLGYLMLWLAKRNAPKA